MLFICLFYQWPTWAHFSLIGFSRVKSGKPRSEWFPVTTHSGVRARPLMKDNHRAKTRKQKVSGEAVMLQRKLRFGTEWVCESALQTQQGKRPLVCLTIRLLGRGKDVTLPPPEEVAAAPEALRSRLCCPGSFDALGFVRGEERVPGSPAASTSAGNTNEQQALYADRQGANEMLGWQLKLD